MPGWRYSINYGPDGEEDWANLITPEGEHVANIRTRHAIRIVSALSASSPVGQNGALAEAARAGWERGRKSWCPAGVLADEVRTEREWESVRQSILTAIEPVAASPSLQKVQTSAPDGWKPTAKLEWENVDNTSQWAALPDFWMCYRISLRSDGMKALRLEWLGNRTDELGVFPEWDDARAAANSDLAFRAEPLARFAPKSPAPSPVGGDVLALLRRPDVYHALEIGRIGRPYSDVQGYLYMAEQYRGHSSAYAAQFTDYGLAHAACVLFNVADDLLRALSSKQRSEKE